MCALFLGLAAMCQRQLDAIVHGGSRADLEAVKATALADA